MPHYSTVAEVADELSVSENEIRGLVSAGEIECTRIGGRIFFTAGQVEDARALLDEQGEENESIDDEDGVGDEGESEDDEDEDEDE